MTSSQQTISPQEATRHLLDVSVTERAGFRSCRRRWKLETLDNLTPRVPTWHFAFGTGMHAALEELYLPKGTLSSAQARLQNWHANELLRAEKDELDGLAGADEFRDDLKALSELGMGMLENYVKFDKTSKIQLGKVLAVEGKFRRGVTLKPKLPKGYPKEAAVKLAGGRLLVPIVDPISKEPILDGAAPSYGGPYLTGRIDLLTERKTPKKGLWVADHKTASRAPNDAGLEFDDQITGYCYIVWRYTGMIPRGVVYNTLIKQLPKEPRWGKSGKLSYAKDQLTTADQYREAIKEAGLMGPGGTILSDPHEECMEALLARGWDPFFRRYETTRNLEQLEQFENRLFVEYYDMLGVGADAERQYPNPSTFACPGCPVRMICLAMEDGSDWEGVIETEFREDRDRKAVVA